MVILDLVKYNIWIIENKSVFSKSSKNRVSFERYLTNTLNNTKELKFIKLVTFFSSYLIHCLNVSVLIRLK